MSRPRIAIGEHGEIRLTELPDGRIQAYCRFRGEDGQLRPVKVIGTSKSSATKALKSRVRERVGDRGTTITGDLLVSKLAELWWDDVVIKYRNDKISESTLREYRRYRDHVVQAVGGLRLRECETLRLRRAIQKASGDHHRKANEMKRILSAMFEHAAVSGWQHNPAKHIELQQSPGVESRALTDEELTDMRHLIHIYETSGGSDAPRANGKGRGGRPRSQYLSDVFDLQLALGGRIGEVLALQWDEDIAGLDDVRQVEDLDGDDAPVVTVTIQSTLKHRSKADSERLSTPERPLLPGLYRQTGEHRNTAAGKQRKGTKTKSGYRQLTLGKFGVGVLLRLRDKKQDGVPWVIATSKGTPYNPANVRTALRKARGEEYGWVTPHTLRRTTITRIIATTGDVHAASRFAGHSNLATTQRYEDQYQTGRNVSAAIDTLG